MDHGDAGLLTPLAYACRKNNLDVARFLIDNGADVNREFQDDWSPLRSGFACQCDPRVSDSGKS